MLVVAAPTAAPQGPDLHHFKWKGAVGFSAFPRAQRSSFSCCFICLAFLRSRLAIVAKNNEVRDHVAMHAVRVVLVQAQAAAAGLPLWTVPISSPCTSAFPVVRDVWGSGMLVSSHWEVPCSA